MSNIAKAHRIAAIRTLDNAIAQGQNIEDLSLPAQAYLMAHHPDSPTNTHREATP